MPTTALASMSTVRLTAGSSSGRVLEEVGEIIDLMVPQAEGAREPVPTAWCGAGHGVLRYASVEVLHHVPDFRERAVAEEGASVLELPKHHHAELEGVRAVESDLRPFLDRGSSDHFSPACSRPGSGGRRSRRRSSSLQPPGRSRSHP